MKGILIIIAAVVFSAAAFAQHYDKDQLAKPNPIFVIVDGDEDECVPRLGSLRVEAELVLRGSGIILAERLDRQSSWLVVSVTSIPLAGLQDSCVASLEIYTFKSEKLADGTTGQVHSSDSLLLLYGPKSTFSQRLRESVNEQVSKLANEILKARGAH